MNKTSATPTNTPLTLTRRAFIRAQNTQPGTTIVCEQGMLWLTQSGDYRDYMLRTGDHLTINKKSKVLIEALSEARVSIQSDN
jgi:hypothetical protein